MPWISIGLLTPNPDQWVTTAAVAETSLLRVTWLKGNAPLSALKAKILLRRKFVPGEVDQAIICYPSDEPLVLTFADLGENFRVQIKKLFTKRYPLISEPGYQILIEFYAP